MLFCRSSITDAQLGSASRSTTIVRVVNQLRLLYQLHPFLGRWGLAIHSSRLHHCNALYVGLSWKTACNLRLIHIRSSRLRTGNSRREQPKTCASLITNLLPAHFKNLLLPLNSQTDWDANAWRTFHSIWTCKIFEWWTTQRATSDGWAEQKRADHSWQALLSGTSKVLAHPPAGNWKGLHAPCI